MKPYHAAIAAAFIFAGCKPETEKQAGSSTSVSAASSAAAALPLVAPPPTLDDWKKALVSTYRLNKKPETDSEGITTFMPCFGQEEKRCLPLMFGKHDTFRKRYFFTPVQSQFERIIGHPYLHAYISLPQCGKPLLLLNPVYSSRAGWLFLNRLGVMVDGELVIDKEIPDANVERENDTRGVEESGTILASDQEINALRRAAPGKPIVVRMTGKSSYATVEKKLIDKVTQDISDVLAAYDKLNNALPSMPESGCK